MQFLGPPSALTHKGIKILRGVLQESVFLKSSQVGALEIMVLESGLETTF